MLFVGYFEGIDSQRGVAWRCADSLSLRSFLGLDLTEKSPDHSSLTRIRDRYPMGVAEQVFAFVLGMARERKLISGTQVGVDATLLWHAPGKLIREL
jgi:transposase